MFTKMKLQQTDYSCLDTQIKKSLHYYFIRAPQQNSKHPKPGPENLKKNPFKKKTREINFTEFFSEESEAAQGPDDDEFRWSGHPKSNNFIFSIGSNWA